MTLLSGVDPVQALYDPLLPLHVAEVLMFVVLGLELSKDYTRGKAIISFFMVLLWFFAQAFVWTDQVQPLYLWGVLLIQGFLTFLYFSENKHYIWRRQGGGDFAYAGLYLIAMFALAKLLVNLASWAALWGLAVLLACLGYLLPRHGYEGDLGVLSPAGTVLGLLVALTIGGMWLALV